MNLIENLLRRATVIRRSLAVYIRALLSVLDSNFNKKVEYMIIYVYSSIKLGKIVNILDNRINPVFFRWLGTKPNKIGRFLVEIQNILLGFKTFREIYLG